MEGIGIILKRTRESRGIELLQVSSELKVRLQYLSEIEQEDGYSVNDVYKFGYIRMYADYLGLDIEQYIQEIKNNSAVKFHSVEEVITEKSKPPSLTIIVALLCFILSVILLVIFGRGYYFQDDVVKQQEQFIDSTNSVRLFLVDPNKFVLENLNKNKPLIIVVAKADSSVLIEGDQEKNSQKFYLKQGESHILPVKDHLMVVVDIPDAIEFYEFSAMTMNRKKLTAE